MKKILIANRGEIAVRVIRACQELGLKTVAIHSVADKDSLHTKIADESICIGPGPSLQSYLHIPAIMAACEVTGVDGLHPGYGFLSESSEFAQVCRTYGVKFIGPTPEQILALGHKVEAKKIARKAKVPLLPGSDGVVYTGEEARSWAKKIGFPLIIKAAAGGGGRGMKIVWKESELEDALALAQREAKIGFGNPDCFIEKYLVNPRHVEIQLMADEKGHCVALGERDCSIQRRHQKVIEEAPCPVLTPELRRFAEDRAIGLAKEVNYQSLGTAEFLYENGQFYFMEMNTRVQVEHPVTEQITGFDLVKQQIRIALGETIDDSKRTSLTGHSIECRINAEDPKSFAPWPGKITAYHQPGGPGVRVDGMIYSGYTVPSLYDSMIAKVITYGKDRPEALIRMVRALKEMRIEGIRTNIPFHLKVLASPEFQSGDVSTNFLAHFSH